MTRAARDFITLAADLPLADAVALYGRVADCVGVVKVGLSLFVEHGPLAVRAFTREGATVFLDLKLHDIPNTVEWAARRAVDLGIRYLTVHASGGSAMLEAARRGVEGSDVRLLAVTVLTSRDAVSLREVGLTQRPAEAATALAALAWKSGLRGVVCSPREVRSFKAAHGPSLFACTPGIRPAGSAPDDQARAETPATAIAEGSDMVVVGRPIYAAVDPVVAARLILADVEAALTE